MDVAPDSQHANRFRVPRATLDAAEWLVFQVRDPRRFELWLNFGRSDEERQAIMRHIRRIEGARHGGF